MVLFEMSVLDLYKKFRNRVTESLRESKASYFYNYFQKNNMKQLWSGIKSVISIRKSSNINVINLHVVLGWNSPSGYSGFSKLSKSLEGYWLASLFPFPWKLGFCYGGHSQSHVGKETKKIGCIIIIVTLWFGRCSILFLFLF